MKKNRDQDKNIFQVIRPEIRRMEKTVVEGRGREFCCLFPNWIWEEVARKEKLNFS